MTESDSQERREPDPDTMLAELQYEASCFARKYAISLADAQRIVEIRQVESGANGNRP